MSSWSVFDKHYNITAACTHNSTVKKAEIRNVWCHQQAYMTMKFWWLWMGQDFHDLKQSLWPRNFRGTIQKIHVSKVLDPQTWKSMISAFQNIKNFQKTPLDDKVMMFWKKFQFFLVSHVQNHQYLCWPKIWQWYIHSYYYRINNTITRYDF